MKDATKPTWYRFLTWRFWHLLFTLKYPRHQKAVIEYAKRMSKEKPETYIYWFWVGWYNVTAQEYGEGPDRWG